MNHSILGTLNQGVSIPWGRWEPSDGGIWDLISKNLEKKKVVILEFFFFKLSVLSYPYVK